MRKLELRVPKSQRCPHCGAKCLCKSVRRHPQKDGTEMRVRYRYCPKSDCNGSVKETDWLTF